jgi:hypothetical protein
MRMLQQPLQFRDLLLTSDERGGLYRKIVRGRSLCVPLKDRNRKDGLKGVLGRTRSDPRYPVPLPFKRNQSEPMKPHVPLVSSIEDVRERIKLLVYERYPKFWHPSSTPVQQIVAAATNRHVKFQLSAFVARLRMFLVREIDGIRQSRPVILTPQAKSPLAVLSEDNEAGKSGWEG